MIFKSRIAQHIILSVVKNRTMSTRYIHYVIIMSSMFVNIFYISIFQWNCILTAQNHMNSGVIVKKRFLCAYLLQQMTDMSLFCFTVITSHSAACNTFRHLWESMAQMAWNEKSFPNIVSIFIELNLGAGNGTLCYMDSKQMSALTGSAQNGRLDQRPIWQYCRKGKKKEDVVLKS